MFLVLCFMSFEKQLYVKGINWWLVLEMKVIFRLVTALLIHCHITLYP